MKNMIRNMSTLCAMLVAGPLIAAVTARYTFDDPNDLVKASIGSDASVKSWRLNEVAGVGGLTPTNGHNHLDGVGAVAIPQSDYLVIPHGLDKTVGSRWFMRMRFFLPDGNAWRSFLQLSQGNDTYAFLYFHPTDAGGELGSGDYWGNYSHYDNLVGRWHTLVFSCDGTKTTYYLDGRTRRTTVNNAPFAGGSDLTGVDYFYVSTGDSYSDGGLMFVDDILIGTGTYEENVVEAPSIADVKVWNGQVRTNNLQSAAGYTMTATNGTDVGLYPVTISLVDKTKVWADTATSDDRTSWFAIREGVLCPKLRTHFTFDDAGNGGLNLLKASMGSDASVFEGGYPAVAVGGIGNLCATNSEFRQDGAGAVYIPVGQYLSVPHGLKRDVGERYRIDMRIYGPEQFPKNVASLLSIAPGNSGDGILFVKQNKTDIGLGSYWGGYANIPSIANRWYNVSIVCEGTEVSFWVDGTWCRDKNPAATGPTFEDLSDISSFLVAADNSGEEGTILLDDLKIYAETELIRVAPPVDAGSCVATGAPQSPVLRSKYYAIKAGATGTAPGTYPVTVGLLDPDRTTWVDGTTADKTVNFTISAAANAWTVEPAIGATTWAAGDPAPACRWNVSAAHGTPVVTLDGQPFDGKLPTAAGRYTLTYSVPATTEWTGLCREYELTVLAEKKAVPSSVPRAASYVSDGLVMELDAIENSEAGVHGDASTVWKDLSGNGYDWTVDLANATWSSTGLDFLGRGIAASRSNDTTFDGKFTTVEFLWKTDINASSFIFTPGLASSAYVFVDPTSSKTGIGLCDRKRVLTPLYKDTAYSVLYNRAPEASTPTDVTNVLVNASSAEIVSGDYWVLQNHQCLGGRGNGSPMSATGTLRALRVYDRPLTMSERALNAYVDVLRYGVGKISTTAVSHDGYMQEGAVVLARVTVKSPDGRISIGGAEWSQDQTVWVPVGTPVTVDLKYRGVTSARIDAFNLVGLPGDTLVSSDGKKLTFVASTPVSATISHPDAAGFGFILYIR